MIQNEMKAKVILNESFAITSKYRVVLYVVSVPPSKKFPTGIKAKYVLIDVEGGVPRLLVDNHEPFGFHMHTHLPEDETVRMALSVTDHNDALVLFNLEVERIVQNDQR